MYRIINFFIPHKLLTYLAGKLAHSKRPWLKNALIGSFIKFYKPNMDEAIYHEANHYENFSTFFSRELNFFNRKIYLDKKNIISPVDGQILDVGKFEDNTLIQAKKFKYSATELLENDNIIDELKLKSFVTLYLSPQDYHRIHSPLKGTIKRTKFIPGSLFSVNKSAQRNIPSLYLRNERAWVEIENKDFSIILVFVGASIVSGIIPCWHEDRPLNIRNLKESWQLGPSRKKDIEQGEYIAHFSMGSTVIMLLPEGIYRPDALLSKENVRFGEVLFKIDK